MTFSWFGCAAIDSYISGPSCGAGFGGTLSLQLLKSINASKHVWNVEEVGIKVLVVLGYIPGSRTVGPDGLRGALRPTRRHENHQTIHKEGRLVFLSPSTWIWLEILGNNHKAKGKLCVMGSEHSGFHSFPIPTRGPERDTVQLRKWGGVVKILDLGLREREVRPGIESQSPTQGIPVTQ